MSCRKRVNLKEISKLTPTEQWLNGITDDQAADSDLAGDSDADDIPDHSSQSTSCSSTTSITRKRTFSPTDADDDLAFSTSCSSTTSITRKRTFSPTDADDDLAFDSDDSIRNPDFDSR
ncbi:hypothetical protein QE152_g21971 [Popillia japonica]|uniref:Uncharacterized protein n=1 Tax=Popillia japonica TaxID=7064 RepID=A0AAW1KLR7_POPJA